MSRTASQLRTALENARNDPVVALPRFHSEPAISEDQARADRDEAIADLEAELAQREAEEAGSWGAHHGHA